MPRSFAIFDDAEQVALVKKVLAEYHLDPRQYAPRAMLSMISRSKSELGTPESFSRTVGSYFLTSVTDWNSNQTTYAYHNAGQLTPVTLPLSTGIVGTRSSKSAVVTASQFSA